METKPERAGLCKEDPQVLQWPLSPGLPDAIGSPPAQRTEEVDASSSGSLKAESNSIDSIRSTSLLTQAGLPLGLFYPPMALRIHPPTQPSLSLQGQSSLLKVMILTPCPQCLHCSALIHFVSLDLDVTSSGSLPLFAKVIGLLVTSALSIVWLPIRNASRLYLGTGSFLGAKDRACFICTCIPAA